MKRGFPTLKLTDSEFKPGGQVQLELKNSSLSFKSLSDRGWQADSEARSGPSSGSVQWLGFTPLSDGDIGQGESAAAGQH